MSYEPSPFPTDSIALSQDLIDLTEQLAENAHEIWAQGRVREGWTLGESRDDAAKTHPCLVPYTQLPESEKEFDRRMAMQTLKVIVALGYRITKAKPRGETHGPRGERGAPSKRAALKKKRGRSGN